MGIASLHPSHGLVPDVVRQSLELPFHRIDPGDIGRDEVVAAAFVGGHAKLATRESGGGAGAAEMDEGGEVLLLLRAGGHVGAVENR